MKILGEQLLLWGASVPVWKLPGAAIAAGSEDEGGLGLLHQSMGELWADM
jgi:hypothetical protein